MNNQKGKSIVRYTCEHCFKTWRQKESFLKHLEICKGDGSAPKYHCDKCLRTFAYGSNYRKHKCKEISQINTCQFCNKDYSSQVPFDKHVEICAKRSKWLTFMGNDDDGGAPKYQCDKCLKTFVHWRGFINHKCKSQQKKTCHYCNKNYVSQEYFDKHVEICAKRSKWLTTSMGDNDGGSAAAAPKYQCDKCLKTFATVGHGLMIAINAKKTLRKRRVIIAIKITLVKFVSTNILKSVQAANGING